jgi:hypothetical protein
VKTRTPTLSIDAIRNIGLEYYAAHPKPRVNSWKATLHYYTGDLFRSNEHAVADVLTAYSKEAANAWEHWQNLLLFYQDLPISSISKRIERRFTEEFGFLNITWAAGGGGHMVTFTPASMYAELSGKVKENLAIHLKYKPEAAAPKEIEMKELSVTSPRHG